MVDLAAEALRYIADKVAGFVRRADRFIHSSRPAQLRPGGRRRLGLIFGAQGSTQALGQATNRPFRSPTFNNTSIGN
jgi:hypothetical protein